jgi:hypothetical protein
MVSEAPHLMHTYNSGMFVGLVREKFCSFSPSGKPQSEQSRVKGGLSEKGISGLYDVQAATGRYFVSGVLLRRSRSRSNSRVSA